MIRPISEIVGRIIDKLSNTNGYKKAMLEKQWAELVGEAAKKHCRLQKIDKGILYVCVDSSVWNQALFIDKANLIRRINQKFARPIVEEVKYLIGHFESVVIEQSEKEGAFQADSNIFDTQQAVSSLNEITDIWNHRILLSLYNKKKKKICAGE